MLGLIVVAIMMGFPTAFTLMGLGMIFGYIAFWVPGGHWYESRIFDLIVQRTYGVMTNDVLLSIPLFVLMGFDSSTSLVITPYGRRWWIRCSTASSSPSGASPPRSP